MRGKCCSVVIFLGSLPTQLTARELRSVVENAIEADRTRGESIRRHICHCSILRITNLDTGAIELQGLVEIQPAVLAIRAIERLHGLELYGERITARRYRQRSPMRSSRIPTVPETNEPESLETSAQAERRRRSNVQIEMVGAEPAFLDRITDSLRWPWSFFWTKPSDSPAP
jgi:RNA recognition motif-containing protein